ncbi:signal transduction histidine kinase [Pseudarthrobacter defluvii]|uniref:sensor histidine kinase n=1 Tax=Pseudarthrobacter defluvii TaxID=410837 RepID=UPI00277DF043|nr:sensor histidine kinase [Pseudarthrobacter defluvii]MDQ0767562.1 signal transduction histidine kinase [Pseudarthrobacter defluvii]
MPATPLPPSVETAGGSKSSGPLGALENASSAAILRVLRVTLHTGFALLLAVALARTLMAGGSLRWVWAGAAVVLAAAYLAGTVVEKRHAEGRLVFNPRRYALPWLGVVTGLWAFLLAGSADFAWLAFPIFFLHLHLLPRRPALLIIALMTAAVIASQWAVSGAPVPHAAAVVGPVLGAVFSVITGLAYAALYREAENQRRAADQLRRTREELARSQHEAGVLAERERLAREIHDTLAQGLSSIVLLGRAAGQSLTDGDTATASGQLALVQQTAADNLAEARSFVRGLTPPQLEGTSLVEVLRRLCDNTEAGAAASGVPLRCRLEVDGEPQELPQTVRVTLLRAAQASLANVREHARATAAVVSLAFLGTEVTMDVYDDGTGFDPSVAEGATDAADGSGFGLRSLRERVTALNGLLAVESAPGEGTVVAIRLPVEER